MNVYEEGCCLKTTSSPHSSQLHEKSGAEKLLLLEEKKPLVHSSVLVQGLEEDFKNGKELTFQVGCRAGL